MFHGLLSSRRDPAGYRKKCRSFQLQLFYCLLLISHIKLLRESNFDTKLTLSYILSDDCTIRVISHDNCAVVEVS